MKLELKPRGSTSGGSIEWNPETGEIVFSNKSLERDFADILALVGSSGYINTWPYLTTVQVSDPTRNISEFAALCGTHWEIPPELQEYYPQIEDNSPVEAIN